MGKPFKLTRRSQEELHAMGLHDNNAEQVQGTDTVEWFAKQLYTAYMEANREYSQQTADGNTIWNHAVDWEQISGTAIMYRDIWCLTALNLIKKGFTIGTC